MQTYGTLAKVGDTQLNVYTEGTGPVTIVFLAGSGVGCPGYEYKPVYRRLSDRWRIAVVEKAGYGLSGKATTPRTVEQLVEESRAALRAVGIAPPYVLAPHSYSGFEAIWWANTYPDEVCAVLGLDMGLPNMMRAQAKEIPHEQKKAMVARTRSLMQKLAKRGLLAKLLRSKTVNASGLLTGTELTAEEKAAYEDVYYRNIASEAVFEESVLAEENAEKADATGYLKCPVCLVVSSMRSPVKALTWQQAAKEYASHCDAELHQTSAGHMLHAEIPDEVAAIFRAFLERHGI